MLCVLLVTTLTSFKLPLILRLYHFYKWLKTDEGVRLYFLKYFFKRHYTLNIEAVSLYFYHYEFQLSTKHFKFESSEFFYDGLGSYDKKLSELYPKLSCWSSFNRGAQQIKGDKCSYLPKCQTNLVIVLHALSLLFCNFTNKTAYHLADKSLQLLLLKSSMI